MINLNKINFDKLVDFIFEELSSKYSPYLTKEKIEAYMQGVVDIMWYLIPMRNKSEYENYENLVDMIEDQAEKRYNVYLNF